MKWIALLWFLFFYVKAQLTGGDLVDLLPEGTSNVAKTNQKVDDDKKTLAQQVAEGRYGLIPNEIFKTPVTRPGIVSYESNSEVPSDNVNNLGGLNESDIWLAENHLLVLKGGVLSVIDNVPEYATDPVWAPIDDYKAPKRPVKIPNNPKVPPPFPVQLTEGGPIQILGTNFTRTLNGSFYPPEYPISPVDGYEPGSAPFFSPPYQYPSNVTAGQAPFADAPLVAPVQGGNQSGYETPPTFPIGPGMPPFFESLPPGSAVLPPPNMTEEYDEDDLSIYYPPPYSFYYKKENISEVPPGPLVPGIVLPPPPNFFSLLQKPTATPAQTTTLGNTMRNTTTIPTPVYIKPTLPTHFSMRAPHSRNRTVSVTILRPVKTTTKKPAEIPNKPFEVYGPPPTVQNPKVTIKTTKVPLKAYYSTSSDTDNNLVTLLEKDRRTTKSSLRKTPPPPQIYYYDDTPSTNLVTPYSSEQRTKANVPRLRTSSRYYLPVQPPPRTHSNNFNTHIVQLQDEIGTYQTTRTRVRSQTPKPVYQYSFEVSNYKEQHEKLHPAYQPSQLKHAVEIQSAIEVSSPPPPPIYHNRPIPIYLQPQYDYAPPVRSVTPNPVYEQYYTKPDERGLDDITKTYFTTFGKRIRTTTPLPPRNNEQVIFGQQQQSRRHHPKRPNEDAIVNYLKRPLQTDHSPYVDYPQISKVPAQYIGTYQSPSLPEHDYRPKLRPNIQTIQAINVPVRATLRENQAGSFISYELPGDDGAHFYFLTPQLSNYYRPQSDDSRIRQNRET